MKSLTTVYQEVELQVRDFERSAAATVELCSSTSSKHKTAQCDGDIVSKFCGAHSRACAGESSAELERLASLRKHELVKQVIENRSGIDAL